MTDMNIMHISSYMLMILYAFTMMLRLFFTKVDKYFRLKPDSIREPDMYLGAKVRPMKLGNGVWTLDLSPSQYVQESCRNV